MRYRDTLVSLALLFLLMPSAMAGSFRESAYRDAWCAANDGATEYVLFDRTRVDCLTETHAVEVDFAYKWAESIGQSMYYAKVTGRVPGVVLIIEDEERDAKYLNRLGEIAKCRGIRVWTITPMELR